MNAVCIKCGGKKKEPMKMCAHCHTLPETRDERILAFGLSTQCIKQENVIKAGSYIRKKGKPPRLHEKVRAKAKQLVKAYRQPVDASKSMEFSASFFDFNDLVIDDSCEDVLDIVVVHSIGKPADGEFASISKVSTYIEDTWTIGVDITQAEVDRFADEDGELNVWFRWLEGVWQPKFVSKTEFARLREFSK